MRSLKIVLRFHPFRGFRVPAQIPASKDKKIRQIAPMFVSCFGWISFLLGLRWWVLEYVTGVFQNFFCNLACWKGRLERGWGTVGEGLGKGCGRGWGRVGEGFKNPLTFPRGFSKKIKVVWVTGREALCWRTGCSLHLERPNCSDPL